MRSRALVALCGALWLSAGCEPEPMPCDQEFDAVFRYGDGSEWDDHVAIAGAGDVNGDGYADVLIGDGMRRGQAGATHLFFGPVEGELFLEDADVILEGITEYDRSGEAVAGAGDVDGDGFDDLLVAAPQATIDLEEQGVVYLLRGPVEPGRISLADADAKLRGHRDNDHVGSSLAGVGDLDGDGLDDILIGARSASPGSSHPGSAYVLYGPVGGDRDLADADAELRGEAHGDKAGDVISSAGDFDGDGAPDLLIGAMLQDAAGFAAGAAYVQFGPVDGFVDLEQADLRMLGTSGDRAGVAVAGGGDLDGDGYADVVVGSEYGLPGAVGTAHVVFGPRSGNLSLPDADVQFEGVSYAEGVDELGESLAIPGDMTGDGLADLVLGAPGVWDVVYLLHGPVECSGVIAEECDATYLKGEDGAWSMGELVAPAGDVNGDGYPDLLVGAPVDHQDGGVDWSGAVYLFHGGPCL